MKKLVLALGMMLLASACDSGLDVDEKDVRDAIADGTEDTTAGTQSTDDSVTADAGSTGGVNTDVDTSAPESDDTVASGETAGATVDTADTLISDTSDASVTDGGDTQSGVDTDTGTMNGDTEEEVAADTAAGDAMGSDDAQPEDTEVDSDASEDMQGQTTDTDSVENAVDEDTETAVSDSDNSVPVCVPTLIINEIDYDVPGKDTAEFVELFNPTDCAISVEGLSLVLVNGSNMEEYRRISLADTGVELIGGGEYVVIHGADLVVPETALEIIMSYANGFIQNGPDGLAVFDGTTGTVLDAFCYEAALNEVIFKGVDGVFDLVEGEMNPELVDSDKEGVSISRIPDGADSQNTAMDWALTAATPGEQNALLPQ